MATVPPAWGSMRLAADAGQKRPAPNADPASPSDHDATTASKRQAVGKLLAENLNMTYDKLLAVAETKRTAGTDKMERITRLVCTELTRLVAASSFKKTFAQTAGSSATECADVRVVRKAYEDANLRQASFCCFRE